MSNDLTKFAAEGWDAAYDVDCPYLATSNASNAWHLGRYLRDEGERRPTPNTAPRADKGRIVITAGRSDMINIRGYADTLIRRFCILPGTKFKEIRL